MKTPGLALLLAATQAGVSDPLTNNEVGGDHRQLGQGPDGAGLRDAGNCDQKVEPELQLRIAGDHLQGFARQSLRGPLMKADAALQILADDFGQSVGGLGCVQVVLLRRAQIGDRLRASGQRAQVKRGGARAAARARRACARQTPAARGR